MKNKTLWLGLAVTAIIILVLFIVTYKTDEDKVVGKWNGYDQQDELVISITFDSDHTGIYFAYGETYPMDWHISDGFMYLDVQDGFGYVETTKYSYKQEGIVLTLKNETTTLPLYLDGKPRNAIEGVEMAGEYTEWSWR